MDLLRTVGFPILLFVVRHSPSFRTTPQFQKMYVKVIVNKENNTLSEYYRQIILLQNVSKVHEHRTTLRKIDYDLCKKIWLRT